MSVTMRRVVALLVLAVAQGCQVPCHWNDKAQLVAYMDGITSKMIALDRMINDHCRANNVPKDVKYYHNDENFQIVYPIAGFQPEDFTVKAGRRILFIEANNCDEDLHFSDIRYIPDYLLLNQGKWNYEEDELTISIPYASGGLGEKNYLSFASRNLQVGSIVLRKGTCQSRCSRRRSGRDIHNATIFS